MQTLTNRAQVLYEHLWLNLLPLLQFRFLSFFSLFLFFSVIFVPSQWLPWLRLFTTECTEKARSTQRFYSYLLLHFFPLRDLCVFSVASVVKSFFTTECTEEARSTQRFICQFITLLIPFFKTVTLKFISNPSL